MVLPRPRKGLPKPPQDRDLIALADGELPAYFTREEVDRILDQVEGRDRLFLSLLWQTGARVIEDTFTYCIPNAKKLAPQPGLEPGTKRLTAAYATIALLGSIQTKLYHPYF